MYIAWQVMDKIEGDICPRCGQRTLDVYYEEGSDLQLGARCEECGLKGFYVSGKLVPLATT
jgi:DNA-directed RNA polymerase subunit RPC12/RpoP